MITKRIPLKVGDSVRIAMPIHGRYCLGRILSVDGYDVYVKLNYKGIEVHRLYHEVKLAKDKNQNEIFTRTNRSSKFCT